MTFLPQSVNSIFFGILNYWRNNLIVFAAINITGKVDNYRYKNFLVEEKTYSLQ